MNDFAIVTEGLGRKFGARWAVRHLDLKVPQGAVVGLLGPNGSGKTTTINMLMGLLPPTEGKIQVLGMNPQKDDVAIRRKTGYVPEIYGFYEWMKVDQLVALVAAYHPDWNWTLCHSLKSEFKLDGDMAVKGLSKGTKAKLALLLALSFEPPMLVLDEPTGGLDPAARRNFIETILGQYQDAGKTILVSSHLLNEFSGLLDHVAFVKEGRIEMASRLDELHRRTKRARLIFDEGIPSHINFPGAIAVKKNGREALVTCRDFDPEKTPGELKQSGASNIIIEEMTLEDIFVDLVGS
ncbi:MAG: ABC transporter ATP-binding protein [Candidatus Omnitrophota bacterium]